MPASSAVSASTTLRHVNVGIPAILEPHGSIIAGFHTNRYISSSQDTQNGDQNPYGLAYVPRNSGVLRAGDLLVSNFNDNFNIQGLGTTIEYIRPSETHPVPHRLYKDERLTGGEALSILPDDSFLIASTYANLEWCLQPTGSFGSAQEFNPSSNWSFPWGTLYVGNTGTFGVAFAYVVQQDGSLWRINHSGHYSYDEIGYGFNVNHGVAPTTLAVSGLSWDPSRSTLYLLEALDNTIIAIKHPEDIPANGFYRTSTGFGGPYANHVRIFARGGKINAPISTFVIYNGDLLVENTGDNNLLEFSPSGSYLGRKLLDGGGPGALFGVVAIGTSPDNLRIYFNDDNENSLRELSQ